MMNRKILLVITSCVIGLFTAFIYAVRIQQLRDEIADLTDKDPVLIAVRDIKPGEQLQHEDLTTVFHLKQDLPKRRIAPEDIDLILGKKVFHPIPAGETILWTDLPEGPRIRKPSEKIPPGYRAISLPADETHTMVHFVTPGDSVDVVSSNFSDRSGDVENRLVAENIVILSVGQRLEEWSQPEPDEAYPLSVTILATPNEARRILKAAQSGEINFLAKGTYLLPTVPGGEERSDSAESDTRHR